MGTVQTKTALHGGTGARIARTLREAILSATINQVSGSAKTRSPTSTAPVGCRSARRCVCSRLRVW